MRGRRSVEICFPKATLEDYSVLLQLGSFFLFVVSAFIYIDYENILLNKIIAEILQHCNFATTKANGAKNEKWHDQTSCKPANS